MLVAASPAEAEAVPPAGLGAALVQLCADARAALPALAVDERAVIAAIARHLDGGDAADAAAWLARCRPGELAVAAQAGAGDAAAIGELERAHGEMIGSVCRRFAGPGHTADDLRQILRARLFVAEPGRAAKITEYNGQGSLESWLRVVATRLFIDLGRRKDRTREAPIGDAVDDALAAADLGLDAVKAEYRAAVAAALGEAADQLEAGDRHLLRQHLVAGLTIDQLGAALGIHRATAARRVARARDQLIARTRELIAARLQLDDHELAEVFGLVISKLDVTLTRLLASRPAAAAAPGPAA